jgi:hypothetical protein
VYVSAPSVTDSTSDGSTNADPPLENTRYATSIAPPLPTVALTAVPPDITTSKPPLLTVVKLAVPPELTT